jgi:hypothetical protein
MPTTNPEKNREYVRTSNMKKKEQIGEEEYNKYFNEDEDEDYLFRIKQFDDEIENIKNNS